MKPPISTEVVVAYAQCPRRAYLLLYGDLNCPPHEYVQILESKKHNNQTQYLKVLAEENSDIAPYDTNGLQRKRRLLTTATLRTAEFEANCGLLTRTASHSSLGRYSYEPTIFVATHSITIEQKLALYFSAYVLEKLQARLPSTGCIIDVTGMSHKVNLQESAHILLPIVGPLQEWTADGSPQEPPVILNKHCPLCQFRDVCRPQAEQEDNLSLLDRVSARDVHKYQRKGIFTVKQLSYTFKPRKRKKRVKNPPPVTHKPELQALAIRESKIYLQELPELARQPVELFLDIEGIPDQDAYYLIGLLVCEGGASTHHAFWADTLDSEELIWQHFIEKISHYPDAPIYHYGRYDAKAIQKLAKRYDAGDETLQQRLINVNSHIYGRVYFPVYSNSLKELGRFIGAAWSSPEASGLQSLVWRHYWDETQNARYRELLEIYNREDCQALKLLTDVTSKIRQSAAVMSDVDFADQPKRQATVIGEEIGGQFEQILRFAHTNYDKAKVRFRNIVQRKDIKSCQSKIHRRKVKPKPGKLIQVPPTKTCPVHGNQPLSLSEKTCQRLIIDLVLTKTGIRKTVTRYVAHKAYCSKCNRYYLPPKITRFWRTQLYGHGFRAWIVYQRVALRQSYGNIVESVREHFNEKIRVTHIPKAMEYLSKYYSETEESIVRQMLFSPFVHADETLINIRGFNQYVWAFTDGKQVIFRLSQSREATIAKEFFTNYDGILVSDFYPGYDSVQCRQQKCWVHLIRDLNADLLAHPFDSEYELFVVRVRNLIVPIMEDVQRFGLKKRHLTKFKKQVDNFYYTVITDRLYKSELVLKYQTRFIRYRESLFTFLEHDGVPWHNNTVENAIRHLAIQRDMSPHFCESVTQDYLILLGIHQTCRFQDKSFFKFLFSGETDIDQFQKSRRSRKST